MRLVTTVAFFILLPVIAFAQASSQAGRILDAMRVDELLETLQQEAMENALELDETMLDGRGGDRWLERVRDINAPNALEAELRQSFTQAMVVEHVGDVAAFFESPLGAKIVTLELSARHALLEPGIEDHSRTQIENADRATREKLQQIEEFVRANDLVNANVAAAMNSNIAFLEGMRSAGGLPGLDGSIVDMTVMQEPEIRESAESWLMSYLFLAYQPLSEQELDSYIVFSETDAGQALNSALLTAFDRVFVQTSRETGEAAGQVIASRDI
ncbi:DUF2059 domain-containing protein [Qingshengfaniella alkalisoli]|uniref:DUF2059 domain-containing protein n=1 Tax=Qingshengfaniella alkalisoli TaxID=2599296 RepID=A0A5B8IRV7_9RHOB|nr:DUF2059 domain-containing protein [Qingshengfaniella alkalisoli]QDY68942.1 DUF2059 domain-containing protein [Qingshengfaniella alkalisoli]